MSHEPATMLAVAIVEDDRDMHESIAAILEGAGHETMGVDEGDAFLGSEAWALAGWAVLDLRPGDLRGLEPLESIGTRDGLATRSANA